MSGHIKLLCLVLLAHKVAAADDAEFAFNLFSDIAPILALFGDRFARQFMSESLEWTDHILFAMVPLGIITAITSAIRVAGSSRLKAFIVYAKENKALAEIELMSSTSEEVCELFNGKSIVRAMGKPEIATFLIFPDGSPEYSNSSKTYIHSPKKIGKEKPKSTKSVVGSIKGDDKSKDQGSNGQKLLRFPPLHPNQMGNNGKDVEKGKVGNETPTASNSTATLGNEKSSSDETAPDFPGPPNLQLNISSGSREESHLQKIQSLILTAIGVILQLGLIAIAGAVELRLSDQGSELFESKAYGFPCYTAGSILLCVGTWLCSVIIEQSTSESLWQVCGDDKPTESAPQLVWLQQAHRVNDQFFKGYVIFAGRKHGLVTSERAEDYEIRLKNKELETELISARPETSPNPSLTQPTTSGMLLSTLDSGSPTGTPSRIKKKVSDNQTNEQKPGNFRRWYDKLKREFSFWELLTSVASVLAALGFILQFMGLRGLAFPCSIAQLLAILVMASVRAFVRRRLGREIHHFEAPAGYELEFFAAYLLLRTQKMTDYMDYKERRMLQPSLPSPEVLLQWRVKTPEYGRAPAIQDPSIRQQAQEAHLKPFPPSAQLVEVRQRLGDLCQWKGKALESALSLSLSIESFMNDFFSTIEPMRTCLDWKIDATNGADKSDDFSILITRDGKDQGEKSSKWRVDLGKVESTLSLWMASIVAKKMKDQKKQPDWRRTKDGDDLKYTFLRIIGDNFADGVLQRDIAWWVGQSIAEESDNSEECNLDFQDDTSPKDSLNSSPDTSSDASHEIVIGYNGTDNQSKKARKGQLSIIGVNSLPVILAQHLFTSFIWAVVNDEELSRSLRPQLKKDRVDIKGIKTFTGFDIKERWYEPQLSHQKLFGLVSRMKSSGLGSTTDILLCIVPALSAKDLLPNSAILTLMPHILPDRELSDIARCYAGLLEKLARTGESGKLRDTVIIRTMDFLYHAHERYHEFEGLPCDTVDWLKTIVEILISTLPTTAVEISTKLAPVYQIQCRLAVFEPIFRRLGVADEDIKKINLFTDAKPIFDDDFAQHTLDFSLDHISVCTDAKTGKTKGFKPSPAPNKAQKLAETRDIFDWTPLHYACAGGQARAFVNYPDDALRGQIPQLGDYFQRNLFHIAAISNKAIPQNLMRLFTDDDGFKRVILKSDCNGLTPLHLAARVGNRDFLETIFQCFTKDKSILKDALAKQDHWGRQPLHIAVRFRKASCITELINAGSHFDVPDRDGKCPIDHFVGSQSTEPSLTDDFGLFLQFKPKIPDLRFNNGKTFLHIAVGVLDAPSFKGLVQDFDINAKDNDGQTALHSALMAEREDIVAELIDRNVDLDVKSNDGQTALHLALSTGLNGIASKLIDKSHDVNTKNDDGQTPLHLALLAGLTDVAKVLIQGFGEKKADVTARDNQGTTALMCAAQGISSNPTKATSTASLGVTRLVDNVAWGSEADKSLFDNLMVGETGIEAVDDNAETALHHAIEASNEAAMLYLLISSRTHKKMFENSESPLVKACQCGFLAAVRGIIDTYPSMINIGDRSYDQPPISWACENGHNDVVEILINNESIEINRPATGYMERTPLHFAVQALDDKCLTVLLKCANLEINMRDSLNKTPLDIAIRRSRFEKTDKVLKLLADNRMSDQERLRSLRRTKYPSFQQPKGLIRGILGSIKDEFLLNEYLFSIIESQSSGMPGEINDLLRNSLSGREGQKLKAPYHRAVLLGEPEVIEALPKLSEDQTDLDKDNWRSLDYAEKLGLTKQLKWEEGKTPNTADQYLMPTTLFWNDLKHNIQITPCSSPRHTGCSKVLDVKVVKDHSEIQIVCIRADHPIPPRGPTKTFYFEIEVLEPATSEWLAIGFCGRDIKSDQMPGWFERSWAFHGDDGGLYMNSGEKMIEPSNDFGENAIFKKGDFVGVQLDTETGMGICTRNGETLNMGNVFKDTKDKYKFGKMYPCVGFRLDEEDNKLHFRVNLGGLPSHPFKYKGKLPIEI